jgi:hypothetical protein
MFGAVFVLVLASMGAAWFYWGGAANPPVVNLEILPPFVAQPVLASVAVSVNAPEAAYMAASNSRVAASAPVPKPVVVAKAAVSSGVVLATAPKVAVSAWVAAVPSAVPASNQARILPMPPAPLVKTATPSVTDVLALAQAQWNASDQTGALAMVQDAMTQLEQSPSASPTALAALAREHTRMSLAMGFTQAALSTLVRLEPQLSSVPDIWALRGNINQRLGQHPRAVQAYLTGLSQRPNEPRWMLGAAVSMAIQGQTGPAAEWVEKARLAGGLRPDVANYLRQLGVDVRAD